MLFSPFESQIFKIILRVFDFSYVYSLRFLC
jgi:hypothetical protein